jgi:hypothetical protein
VGTTNLGSADTATVNDHHHFANRGDGKAREDAVDPCASCHRLFVWAYLHLRPAASVNSQLHPSAAYGPWAYGHMAYSDTLSLYYSFHLANHALPYLDTRVEYPVLTGVFM